jgi:alpha-glucuronidase
MITRFMQLLKSMIRSLALFFTLGCAAAENGLAAWLRYAPLPTDHKSLTSIPSNIVALNSTTSSPVFTARIELQKGIQSIFGQQVSISHDKRQSSSTIVVGTIDAYTQQYGDFDVPELRTDGFWLSTLNSTVQILGQNERGALYGAFEYLSMLAQGNFSQVSYASNPNAPIRWVNQWDNME